MARSSAGDRTADRWDKKLRDRGHCPVTGGRQILPAGPVAAFAVMITGIPLTYWVTGKLLGRNWRR